MASISYLCIGMREIETKFSDSTEENWSCKNKFYLANFIGPRNSNFTIFKVDLQNLPTVLGASLVDAIVGKVLIIPPLVPANLFMGRLIHMPQPTNCPPSCHAV